MSENQETLQSTEIVIEDAKKVMGFVKKLVGDENAEELGKLPKQLKKHAGDRLTQAIQSHARNAVDRLFKKETIMSEYDNNESLEAGTETPTLDTKSEEDPKLYQDAEGKHAKIDTDQMADNSKKNMASIAGKGGSKGANVKEALDALFDGEELSESFQNKAATIFEAAINERINDIEEHLVNQYQEILEDTILKTTEELAEKLDDYLGYVVEQWVEENQLALENGLRNDVTENFISGLKVLFENCYIDVPESKYDLLEEITDVKTELEEDLNKALQENINLRKDIVAHRCGEIFAEEADGLTDMEVEKLASLSEGIEFETEEQYRDKINVLRESYFAGEPVVMTEEVETTNQVINESGPMDKYMSTLSRHANYDKMS